MGASANRTSIYLACFHSSKPESLDGAERQFLTVETAIRDDEWPYDNGDDPSFYAARNGGRLTWGVCRQDLRNEIQKGSIVVFFSFTPLPNNETLYRLCAVETVADRLDHRALNRDNDFSVFRHLYINGLIAPDDCGWRWDETDRPPQYRHKDWLWRIADHRGMTQRKFDDRYAAIYRNDSFPNSALARGDLRLASNFVVFSDPPDRAYISMDPPEVAIAVKGQHENWTHAKLRELTVAKAASVLKNKRDYLRVANPSGRNVHRQIHFHLPTDEANRWRDELIAALRETTESHGRTPTKRTRAAGRVKC